MVWTVWGSFHNNNNDISRVKQLYEMSPEHMTGWSGMSEFLFCFRQFWLAVSFI
jgi:hypothetical protein